MIKNDIFLGGASSRNAPFSKKFTPKTAYMPSMSRIPPEVFPETFFDNLILITQVSLYLLFLLKLF